MKSNTIFLILFGLDAFLELIIPILLPNFNALRFVTKPLLMIFLFLYVLSIKELSNKIIILIALFFAWLGDVFLMIPGSNPLFFQLGLGSFLVMQVVYILLFLKQSFHLKFIPIRYIVLTMIPIILYVGLFLNFLLPNIVEGLQLPVVVYAFALGSMMYFSLQRIQFSSRNNFWLVAFGAFLFVVSDSLLAFGKFYYSFPGNSFLVMSTYILSQLLLIKGLVTFVPIQKI